MILIKGYLMFYSCVEKIGETTLKVYKLILKKIGS